MLKKRGSAETVVLIYVIFVFGIFLTAVLIKPKVTGMFSGEDMTEEPMVETYQERTGTKVEAVELSRIGEVNIYLLVGVLSALIIIAVFLMYVIYRIKKPSDKDRLRKAKQVIEKNLKIGLSEKEIKDAFMNKGWPKEMVDKLIKGL